RLSCVSFGPRLLLVLTPPLLIELTDAALGRALRLGENRTTAAEKLDGNESEFCLGFFIFFFLTSLIGVSSLSSESTAVSFIPKAEVEEESCLPGDDGFSP
ncbi:hypothetical protein THAOC_25153, partial [Thalassiosira oceanica]